MKHNFGLSRSEAQAVGDGVRADADDGEGGHQVATAAVQDGVLPGIMRAHVIKVSSFALQNDDPSSGKPGSLPARSRAAHCLMPGAPYPVCHTVAGLWCTGSAGGGKSAPLVLPCHLARDVYYQQVRKHAQTFLLARARVGVCCHTWCINCASLDALQPARAAASEAHHLQRAGAMW